MQSIDLANEVEAAISACRLRVLGVGDQQYSYGDQQRFESMELHQLFDWTHEELEDVIVYAVMLRIRIKRIEALLTDRNITNLSTS